jgi:glucokinase
MESRFSLVADIGATHARFALHAANQDDSGGESASAVLATADYDSATAMVLDACLALEMEKPASCCFAVAGPVGAGVGQITNGGLSFSASALGSELGCPVHLVNDFFALAMAVPVLADLRQIGGRDAASRVADVKAVIGPGSGLGMSLLIPGITTTGWQVLPSEGGHADLAPGNHLEQEVLGILLQDHAAVCWETVVSGPGLVNLYRAVATLWGVEPKQMTPEQISQQGVDADDPLCHQTLELFFGLLGAAAGNLALTVCARAGVYIGGGIVSKLQEFALSSPLRRRFDERGDLKDFATDIPLYLILDQNPGLIGAGICLDQLSRKVEGDLNDG